MVLGLLRGAENGWMNIVLLREDEHEWDNYSLWKRHLLSFEDREKSFSRELIS